MTDPRFILYDGVTINADLFHSAHADGEGIIVQYAVTLREVKRKDLDRLKTMLDSFTQAGAITRGSLLLTFDGWDCPRNCTYPCYPAHLCSCCNTIRYDSNRF